MTTPFFKSWTDALGAPEDEAATDSTSSWSAMSLLKAIYSQIAGGGLQAGVIAALAGTSSTSKLIATGSQTFTTQAGKSWQAGQWLNIASAADPTKFMNGPVTSYSGTTLIVNVDNTGGSGTLADWVISLSGTQGATGATGTNGATGPAGAMGGPVSSTDNAVARFDGAGGTQVQNSGVIIDDSNNVSGVVALSATTIELGHASDTTLSRASAGDVAVEGNRMFRVGGADVPVADGGTGLSAGTSGGVLGYTANGTLASSAALTASGVVLGGGAGATPTSTSAGTTGQILTGVTSGAPTFQTAGWRLLNTLTASSSATLDDTTSITSTYDCYVFGFENVFPATDATKLQLLVTQDGGGNWLATSYLNGGAASAITSYFSVAGEQLIGNGTSIAGFSGWLWATGLNRTDNRKLMFSLGVVYNSTPAVALPSNSGFYNGNNSAVNGVRFLMSSGNISSGKVRVYGYRSA